MEPAYIIHIITLVSIFGVLALSLNMVVGFTGLLSVAHAAFFGIGAYAVAILTRSYHVDFFLAAVVACVFSIIVSILVGLVFSRFRDDYYALATIGFNIIVISIFLNVEGLTRGALGIPGIPRPMLFGISFGNNLLFLMLALAVVILTYVIVQYITRSSFGRVLIAIREDEKSLQIFGYDTRKYKLIIFAIAAGLAAIAGGLFASYISYIDPTTFTINDSIFMLSMIIVGGLANNRGALLGALILVILPEALRFVGFSPDVAAQMRALLYGASLVALMVYRPQGILGQYKL
jgi:branched-chain amino acid transport system permease protein